MRIEDLMAFEDMNGKAGLSQAQKVRKIALQQALYFHGDEGEGATVDELLETATKFETYLKAGT